MKSALLKWLRRILVKALFQLIKILLKRKCYDIEKTEVVLNKDCQRLVIQFGKGVVSLPLELGGGWKQIRHNGKWRLVWNSGEVWDTPGFEKAFQKGISALVPFLTDLPMFDEKAKVTA